MSRGRPRRSLLLLLAVLGLAAFLLPTAAAAPASGDHRSGKMAPSGLETDAIRVPHGVATMSVAGNRPVHLTVALAPSHPPALTAFDAAVSDPENPEYRHFLTEAQFEGEFAPSNASIGAVERYFAGFGADGFTLTPDRLGLRLSMTVGGAERALGVRYVEFQSPSGAPLFTAVGRAGLPAGLQAEVIGIGGLTDLGSLGIRHDLRTVASGAIREGSGGLGFVTDPSTGGSVFTGSDYVQAYHEPTLFPPSAAVANATFASGEAVATILMSGFNDTTRSDLPPWDPSVIAAYFNDTFPAAWPQPTVSGVPIGLDNTIPPLPAAYGAWNDTSGNEVENSLDLEMAGSFAPGATLVNFYFAASLYANSAVTPGSLQNTADDFAQCLAQALSHSYAPARLAAVTNSYSLPDLNDSLWDTELAHASATGVTVIAASGDQASAPNEVSGRIQGAEPGWPASAAFNSSGTIAVGGISTNLTGQPTGTYGTPNMNDSFDPTVGSLTQETAWYETGAGVGNISGSEGGVSTLYPEPSWQFHSAAQPNVVNVTVTQGLGRLGRSEPDLSFPANNTLIYDAADPVYIYTDIVEGTSIAAPIYAGMLAEQAAVSGHPYGFIDPELYRIGSYFAANPGDSANPFTDILTGGNYRFSAEAGWDGVTGWGTLDPRLFLAADATPAVSNYLYLGPTPGLPPGSGTGTTHSSNGTAALVVLLVALLVLFLVVTLVVVEFRPKARRGYVEPPPGVYTPTPGGPPPAFGPGGAPPPSYGPPPSTFLCPYCGSVRPAEPVRCPACGAL